MYKSSQSDQPKQIGWYKAQNMCMLFATVRLNKLFPYINSPPALELN